MSDKGLADALLQRSVAHLTARPVRDRRIIWLCCIGAATLILIVYLIVPPDHRSASVLLTLVVGLGALAFYFHRRHADDARFVKELLTEFNERYDKLGSDLQFAIWRNGEFEKETELKFIRYFNLCAEEWLFWKAGYIYEEVWRAWDQGMKQYGRDPRVIALWKKEDATDSYYGFKFPCQEK